MSVQDQLTPLDALDLVEDAKHLIDLIAMAVRHDYPGKNADEAAIACACHRAAENLDAAVHSLKGLLMGVAA